MPFRRGSPLNPETQSKTNSKYTTNQTHNPIPANPNASPHPTQFPHCCLLTTQSQSPPIPMHRPIQPNAPAAARSQPNHLTTIPWCRPIPACTSTAQSSIPMLPNPNPTLPNPSRPQPPAAEFIPTQRCSILTKHKTTHRPIPHRRPQISPYTMPPQISRHQVVPQDTYATKSKTPRQNPIPHAAGQESIPPPHHPKSLTQA